jgi:DNA polymerase-3 subunit epsilon
MRVIVFDTETSALWQNTQRALAKQPWTVELYAKRIDTETGEALGDYHSWFKIGVPMDAGAMKVTGLTEEFLLDKPTFVSESEKIHAFMQDCDAYAGHNLLFDLMMLSFDFRRAGIDWDYSDKRLIDTVSENEWRFGFRPNLTLLHETFYNEGFDGAHGAKSDVEATERCLMYMVKEGSL